MRLIPLIMKVNFNYYIEIIMSVSCVGWFIFYYLGYLLGNGLLEIRFSTAKIAVMWAFSIALQIAEGYWYMSMGGAELRDAVEAFEHSFKRAVCCIGVRIC